MQFDFVEWDSDDDPAGNVRHVADNGLSIDEVEDVIVVVRPVSAYEIED